jgi:hypothetical protein
MSISNVHPRRPFRTPFVGEGLLEPTQISRKILGQAGLKSWTARSKRSASAASAAFRAVASAVSHVFLVLSVLLYLSTLTVLCCGICVT